MSCSHAKSSCNTARECLQLTPSDLSHGYKLERRVGEDSINRYDQPYLRGDSLLMLIVAADLTKWRTVYS